MCQVASSQRQYVAPTLRFRCSHTSVAQLHEICILCVFPICSRPRAFFSIWPSDTTLESSVTLSGEDLNAMPEFAETSSQQCVSMREVLHHSICPPHLQNFISSFQSSTAYIKAAHAKSLLPGVLKAIPSATFKSRVLINDFLNTKLL